MQQERDNAAVWMLGWYAAVTVAVIAWLLTLSNVDPKCDIICFSPRVLGIIAAVLVGVPSGLVGLGISSTVLAILTKRSVGPSAGRGTIAALIGLFLGPVTVCGCIALFFLLSRR
jgi:hypothetical protein